MKECENVEMNWTNVKTEEKEREKERRNEGFIERGYQFKKTLN